MTLPTITDTFHIISRPMRDDQDFWRMRNLLIETVPDHPDWPELGRAPVGRQAILQRRR